MVIDRRGLKVQNIMPILQYTLSTNRTCLRLPFAVIFFTCNSIASAISAALSTMKDPDQKYRRVCWYTNIKKY